jgi:hypothetical protein
MHENVRNLTSAFISSIEYSVSVHINNNVFYWYLGLDILYIFMNKYYSPEFSCLNNAE